MKNVEFILRLVISALVIYTSCTGLFTDNFYSRETANWQLQSEGQDMADLFIAVPLLLLCALAAWKGNKLADMITGGILMYLLYSFVIYCFDVHFNRLFIYYCLVLGLTFYSTILFFYRNFQLTQSVTFSSGIAKFTGIYFMVIAVLFYLLWLSEIIPSMINNSVPESLTDVGLPTNAVHAIDLSVFLPFMFITGIVLLKRRAIGVVMGIALLSFCVLMDITIGGLTMMMKQRGLTEDMSVVYIMGILSILSLVLLVANASKLKEVSVTTTNT